MRKMRSCFRSPEKLEILSSSAMDCSSATDFCFSSEMSTTVRSGEGSTISLAEEATARMCRPGAGDRQDRAPRNTTRLGVRKDEAAGQGATSCGKCQGNVAKNGGQV
jgi:hypothetical protein